MNHDGDTVLGQSDIDFHNIGAKVERRRNCGQSILGNSAEFPTGATTIVRPGGGVRVVGPPLSRLTRSNYERAVRQSKSAIDHHVPVQVDSKFRHLRNDLQAPGHSVLSLGPIDQICLIVTQNDDKIVQEITIASSVEASERA